MKKKLTAIIIAIAMILSLAACANTRHALTVNGEEIPAGMFIYMQINAAHEIAADFREAHPDVSIFEEGFNYFEQEWDGKSFNDRVNDRAIELAKEKALVAGFFEEIGLSISAEDEADARRFTNSFWESNDGLSQFGTDFDNWGEFYENIGVGKESHTAILLSGLKEQMLFLGIFGAEGSEPVSEEAIREFALENYVRVRLIEMAYADADYFEIDTIDNMADSFADRFEAGVSYLTLYYEYIDYIEEGIFSFNDSFDDFDDFDGFDDFNNTDDEPADNVLFIDYELEFDIIERIDNLLPDLQDFITELPVNKAGVFRNADGAFVIYRLDLLEREDWLEAENTQILFELKGDEMQERIAERLGGSVNVVLNEAALRRYKPERAAKRFLQPWL